MEAELRKAFERADLDKNGFLTKDEIRQALIEDDPNDTVSEAQIDDVWQQLDLNEDGKVSCQEFIVATVAKSYPSMETTMRSIFAARESDKSEFLTQDEIRQLMMVHTRLPGEEKPNEKITEDEVELALQALDLNHDGKVSCEEFIEAMVAKFDEAEN